MARYALAVGILLALRLASRRGQVDERVSGLFDGIRRGTISIRRGARMMNQVGKGTRLQQAWGTPSSVESDAATTPGKRTLTEALERTSQPRDDATGARSAQSEPAGSPRSSGDALSWLELAFGQRNVGGSPHAAPPQRVADANDSKPNAVIKVIAYSKGKLLKQPWGAKARWEGPLPQTYTGTRGATGWTWDNPNARTVRINSDLQGRSGITVEGWAGAEADQIVVYASAIDEVTADATAERDAHAPGHALDKRDGGDGRTPSVKPGDDRPGAGDAAQGGRPQGEGRDETGSHAPAPTSSALHDGDASRGGVLELGSSDRDEQLADAFERELGLDSLDADGEEDEDGAEGAGSVGGKPKSDGGRTGTDTRIGGTGPGGERARPDGDGKGSEDGGRGGSEGGSRDGERGGAAEGMYGGEGKAGDGGVPSAVALFGGILSVPAAIRGLVELALIASSADVTGAGAQLFKQGLGKIASAAAARKMIAHEARLVAVRETKLALQRIAKDKQTAAAWAKLTAAEKKQATRTIYWELQRKYFEGYLAAARRAKAEATAALRKSPISASAQQRLKTAEMAEEAALAPPVAGRLPRNHEFAGKQFPGERLPPAYRRPGVRFSEAGYPDLTPYAQTLPNGQKSVQIAYTGSRRADAAAANAKAGYKQTPEGFTWHHHEDMTTMVLVPKRLHELVKHTGGVATYKHTSGVAKYGD